MFEAGLLVGAIVWSIYVIWIVVSLFRIVVPRWRRSGVRQTILAAAVSVLALVAIIASNQFVYLDYGLSSRAGLEEARAAEKAAKKADQALAKVEADKETAEAARKKAKEDAKQAAINAKRRKHEAETQAAEAAADKAAALAKKCGDTTMAFVMSQEFVKRNLKAPSTAEFPWYTDDQVSVSQKPDCAFRVIGWVDAQNGFGAQIRSQYVVDLKYIDGSGAWRMTNISIK